MKHRGSLPDDRVAEIVVLHADKHAGVHAKLKQHHAEQLALCDRLEALADELPDVSDTQLCLHLAKRMLPIVRHAHEFEENTLFPIIQAMDSGGGSLAQSLERLRYEHWEDEAFAGEVSEGLINFVSNRDKIVPETLAYMLRGFFEGMRRHIAFEQEHIMPMIARERLK